MCSSIYKVDFERETGRPAPNCMFGAGLFAIKKITVERISTEGAKNLQKRNYINGRMIISTEDRENQQMSDNITRRKNLSAEDRLYH